MNFSCPNFAISKVAKRSAKYLHAEERVMKRVFSHEKIAHVIPTLLDMITKRILTAVLMAISTQPIASIDFAKSNGRKNAPAKRKRRTFL